MTDRIACLGAALFTRAYQRLNPVEPLETGPVKNDSEEEGRAPLPPNQMEILAVRTGTANFFLCRKGPDVICIDSGFCGAVIRRELEALDIDPRSVSHLFLTHSDFDHTGGAALFSNAAVFLSRREERMITGETPRRLRLYRNRPLRRPYTLLEDQDVVQAGGFSVRAISVPGHTPGSMAWLVDGNTLFVGDAFRLIDGKAAPIRRIFTMDMEKQLASMRKLARLEGIRVVLTGHRGASFCFQEAMAHYR